MARPFDGDTLEQIRIDPMRRMASAGSRRLVDGLQTHQAHQAPYPVTAHADTFAATDGGPSGDCRRTGTP